MHSKRESYIGIDVSKDSLELAIWQQDDTCAYANTSQGIAQLIRDLTPLTPCLIAVEASGGYERQVVRSLQAAGLPVSLLNPTRVRRFAAAIGQLAKTDRLDAKVLAHFAQALNPPFTPAQSEAQAELSWRVSRRRQLVKMLTAEKNRTHTAESAEMRVGIQHHIAWLEDQIVTLEAEIFTLLEQQPLYKGLLEALKAPKGVGPVTAFTMVIDLPELGKRTRQTIAALVGVAPLNKDSGKQRGKRRVFGGRTHVRNALHMATLSAIRSNPVIREHYNQLLARGKVKKVAVTACMRKFLVYLNTLAQDYYLAQQSP